MTILGPAPAGECDRCGYRGERTWIGHGQSFTAALCARCLYDQKIAYGLELPPETHAKARKGKVR